MWLIDTQTLRLKYVLSPEKLPYAVLSHTWEEDEVTFQDMTNADPDTCQKKQGFSKIKQTCTLAQNRGLAYAWVDTCCINKESSAELTEAINSMFAWYQKADVCFVYLSDFPAHKPEFPDPLLRSCRWWTRGWTLQELIAPTNLYFFDCEWNSHGGKCLRSLEISEITGIDMAVLEHSSLMKSMPVAKKMSWAARRQTTREEDIAYCLLGVFDVNMSLIYGEGQKAFMRLQEKILSKTNDLTLFAWTAQDQSRPGYVGMEEQGWWGYRGVLARSPVEFMHCRDVAKGYSRDNDMDLNGEFALTNAGLRISTYLARGPLDDYIMYVGSCLVGNGLETRKIGIHLDKMPTGFCRRLPGRVYLAQHDNSRTRQPGSTGPSTIYIRKDLTAQEARRTEMRLGFIKLTFDDLPQHLQLSSIKVRPSNIWDPHRCAFLSQTGLSYLAIAQIRLTNTVTHKPVSFILVCKIASPIQELGQHTVLWALVCSEKNKYRSTATWRSLRDLLDDYVGGFSAHSDHNTAASPELNALCTDMAAGTSAPQLAHLDTHRGIRTGVALETSMGSMAGIRLVFPRSPWYHRWLKKDPLWKENKNNASSSLVAAAVQITRKWTPSSLGSEESRSSAGWTKGS